MSVRAAGAAILALIVLAAAPALAAASRYLAPVAAGGGQAAIARPLPALPLATGARVAMLAHSYGSRHFTLVTSGAALTGYTRAAIGVLNYVQAIDGRFNLDVFPADGWDNYATYLDGAAQGVGSDLLTYTSDAKPGTLFRALRMERILRPDIVYLDIGTNDIDAGVTAAQVEAGLDRQIAALTGAGSWVVVQTLAYRRTWATDDPKQAVLAAVNRWIAALAGRTGVRVCDTRAIDGIAAAPAGYLGSDNLHLSSLGAQARVPVLLAVLQAMVVPGETRSLDTLNAYNLFPLKGLPGTTGSLGTTGAFTGPLATGLKIVRGTGTSTYTLAKEVIAGGNERQLVTVNPVADGTAVHQFRLSTIAAPTTAAMGLAAGDWLEIEVPIQLDGWAGWLPPPGLTNSVVGQPNQLAMGATNAGISPSNYAGIGGRSFVLRSLVQVTAAIDRLRWDNSWLAVSHLSTVPGPGTMRIGSPVFRKIADPRTVWHLP